MTLFKSILIAAGLFFLVGIAHSADRLTVIGGRQFLDGMKAAASVDGGQSGGGFSSGFRTIPSDPSCDPKQGITDFETTVAKHPQLIVLEPCGSLLIYEKDIKAARELGVKIIVARSFEPTKNSVTISTKDNENYKKVLLEYSDKNDRAGLKELQEFGVGFTIGAAIRTFDFEHPDIDKILEPIRDGSFAGITAMVDSNGVLAVDGWSAKENCNPCPKAGACPQKIIEEVKQCCGKAGACPQ